MRYIKKVILENFQSHKYTELEFDEHLNVIVGPSDQGKSAIIRGIKWALFNEPSGNFFIREGAKDCSVTIVFDDGTKIKRYKSKSKNLYYFYDNRGEEHLFEGFGTNVPKEITDVTNIKKVYLDGKQTNSINISDQLEGPFLLSEKTMTRANAIGRLVGVHIVDDAVGETLKDSRNLNLSKRNLMEQLSRLENNLKEYDYLETLEDTVEKLEKIKNKIKKLESKCERLKDIRKKYQNVEKELSDTKFLIHKLKNVNTIEKLLDDLNMRVKIYTFIHSRKKSLLDINKSICYNENVVNSLKDLDKTNEIAKRLEKMVEKKGKLEIINLNYKSVKKNIIFNDTLLKELKNIHIVEQKVLNIYEYDKNLTELKFIKKKFDENNIRINCGLNYLNNFSKIEQIDYIVLELENKVSILLKLINLKDKIDNIQMSLDLTQKTIDKNALQIRKFLQKYKKLLQQFEVCPLCLSKIDSKNIEKIIDNYS